MQSLACTCGRRFSTEKHLRDHRSAVAQFICSKCNLCLRTRNKFKQHKDSSSACGQKRLKDMVWRCTDCNITVADQAALRQHSISAGHAVDFYCCDCNQSFKCSAALNQHLRDKDHKKKKPQQEKEHHRCEKCDRSFRNATALDQHLRSTIHRPISNLTCLAGKICGVECNAHFKSPSAMVAHMESGSCQSGINRQKLNRLIVAQDTDRLITSSSGICEHSGWIALGDDDGSGTCSGVMTPSTDSDEGVLLTPSSSHIDFGSLAAGQLTRRLSFGMDTASTTSDSTKPSKQKYFFCPLCPDTKRPFLTRLALEMHMSSAYHTAKIFHCPSILFSGKSGRKAQRKMKNFSTVSGLVAHIESGVCHGGKAGLRTVMGHMEERLEEMGMSFKLLSV
ncbi:hypothetical protein ACQKWADRAFT_168102 [Trichoderma austrokoningii]